MRNVFLGLTAVLLAALACDFSPAAPATVPETAAPNTLQVQDTLTPDPAPQDIPLPTHTIPATATSDSGSVIPDGEIASSAGVSFLIPNGLASDAAAALSTEVEYPYINPSAGTMPQHLKFTLNNYAAQNTLFGGQILVFKTAEFIQYDEFSAEVIHELQPLQYVDGQPLPENLDGPMFTVRTHAINFQNGQGVRYITQAAQAILPVNNREMFYYFQGLTGDGQFYVEAILAIQASFLAADGNLDTPLPPDGIPFTMADFPTYLNAVTERLNGTDTFSFTPYLDHLDAMMESLQVNGY
jgi:hypothetical protein